MPEQVYIYCEKYDSTGLRQHAFNRDLEYCWEKSCYMNVDLSDFFGSRPGYIRFVGEDIEVVPYA